MESSTIKYNVRRNRDDGTNYLYILQESVSDCIPPCAARRKEAGRYRPLPEKRKKGRRRRRRRAFIGSRPIQATACRRWRKLLRAAWHKLVRVRSAPLARPLCVLSMRWCSQMHNHARQLHPIRVDTHGYWNDEEPLSADDRDSDVHKQRYYLLYSSDLFSEK